ncbi:lysophospholipid acyltransferase family protein [Nioella sp. MMSF_3534]|jgi:KDO2-lipid IV(A) lauroyltransferase|uniref:lysophospholipid acyltransferase family protein n=1 Tax=Nioella sp. MMSF_3534 TaxID=3046720 RepID=UPI00274026DC|nr:lauroyl acyltransferase [Nioella sp. MMSF_3534]
MAVEDKQSRTLGDWIVDRIARAVIAMLLLLPHRARVATMGWIARNLVGPLTGYTRRARKNLAYIWPDMSERERRRIARSVLDNAGRVIIENYATSDQLARAATWTTHGPGLDPAQKALADGRPILFVSGHFGNYQAARAAMNVRGYNLGGLYRPLNNGYFNDHYVRTVEAVGGPAFARGRRGLANFMRHVKEGGHGALLIDQYFADGVVVDFLGKPAPTAQSVGDIALKFNALVIPIYARRLENGIDFDVLLEAPVPHSDAKTMTQALMDSLGAQVRERPGQWFWVHRRWKPDRQAARAAAGL